MIQFRNIVFMKNLNVTEYFINTIPDPKWVEVAATAFFFH